MNAAANAVPKKIPFLKKITPKTICDNVLGIDLADRKWVETSLTSPLALYDLFGIITKTKTGHTDKGDWTAFVGQFKACDPTTGEIIAESGKAHINVLEDLVYSTLVQVQETDPKAQIHIAIRLGIKPALKGKPSQTGYEYWAERLTQTQAADDPIARLRGEVYQARLAAPAAGASSEPAPASSGASEPAPVVQNGKGGKGHHAAK